MMFVDISNWEGYAAAPKISHEEIHMLWHVDFWDGPKSGVLLYREQPCWFQVVAENKEDTGDWYRHFAVVRLTAEQYEEERRWHELFCEKVGHQPNLQPRERWDEFYEPYKHRTPLDLSRNEVVGWFEQ